MADKQVETKVVQVRFDNSKFSKNINKTIKECEKFDKSLQFKGSKNNIRDIQKALDEIDLKDKNKELEKTEGNLQKLTLSFKSESVYDFLFKEIIVAYPKEAYAEELENTIITNTADLYVKYYTDTEDTLADTSSVTFSLIDYDFVYDGSHWHIVGLSDTLSWNSF